MDRRTVTAAVVAAVGVLAVSLAAATLPSTVEPDSGFGGGGGSGSGSGEGGGSGFEPPPSSDRPVDAVEIPFLKEILLVVLVLAAIVLVVHLVRNWRASVATIVSVVVFVALLVILLSILPTPIPMNEEPVSEPVGDAGLGGDGDDGLGGGDSTPIPPVVLLVLTIAVLGAIVVAVRSPTRSAVLDRLSGSDPDPDGDDSEDAAAIGRAAGRAADRIEDGDDLGNDVVRAWREMTDLLDVSRPEATTPREFAAVAVDAGMDPDDVRELTRLFEDVRYGEYAPTPEREERAVRVFRRIERTYGGGDE